MHTRSGLDEKLELFGEGEHLNQTTVTVFKTLQKRINSF